MDPAVTVMSANLWHDWPRQHRWRPRLEAAATMIEEHRADIVLLQEVSRTRRLRADAWLAERLGMDHAYARANGSASVIGFEEGLAILSRFGLAEPVTARMSAAGPVRRMALAAGLDTPLGRMLAVTTHLGLIRGRNIRQVRALRDWVDGLSGERPAVIGGDFNAPAERHDIQRLRRHWTDAYHQARPETVSSTHVRASARGRSVGRVIDYVFIRQPPAQHWRAEQADHVSSPGLPHSDHLAVVARLIPDDLRPRDGAADRRGMPPLR